MSWFWKLREWEKIERERKNEKHLKEHNPCHFGLMNNRGKFPQTWRATLSCHPRHTQICTLRQTTQTQQGHTHTQSLHTPMPTLLAKTATHTHIQCHSVRYVHNGIRSLAQSIVHTLTRVWDWNTLGSWGVRWHRLAFLGTAGRVCVGGGMKAEGCRGQKTEWEEQYVQCRRPWEQGLVATSYQTRNLSLHGIVQW